MELSRPYLFSIFMCIACQVTWPAELVLNWKPEAEFGGFYEADRVGLYKSEGLELQIVSGGVGTPSLQMVASGKAEFGIAAADEIVTSGDRGMDVVGIFAVYQTNPQGILFHKTRSARSIADLMASGTLAFQKGLSSFSFLVSKFGQPKAKIVPYLGSVSQMSHDSSVAIQCYVTSEPLAAERLGLKTSTFLIADTGFNPYSTVVIVRRKLLQEDPKMVEKFLRATTQGWGGYLKNPNPTNAVMHSLNPSIDLNTLNRSAKIQEPLVRGADPMANSIGSMAATRWNELTKQLLALKLIKTAHPAGTYYWWWKDGARSDIDRKVSR